MKSPNPTRPMTYFHSFWTRPFFPSLEARATQDIILWDFEMLTWLVSALEIRRHSPIRLITDSRGLQFVRRTGLAWVYDGRISTELDRFPPEVAPQLFWAGGKLAALLAVDAPCVSVDLDAILWKPFEPRHPVMALHPEDPTWPWYAGNRERYQAFGFDDPRWDWEAIPFTTAIVYFQGTAAARFYAEKAIDFMRRYSAALPGDAPEGGGCRDAMLFAEQRLLPMCMHRLGLRVHPIAQRHPTLTQLLRNERCTHLWSSKQGYKLCPDARAAYLNHLIALVLSRYPEAAPTLAQWKLDRPVEPHPDQKAGGPTAIAPDSALLEEVQGVVYVEDPNIGALRRALPGSTVLPGETVRVSPGSMIGLVTPSGGRVRICPGTP